MSTDPNSKPEFIGVKCLTIGNKVKDYLLQQQWHQWDHAAVDALSEFVDGLGFYLDVNKNTIRDNPTRSCKDYWKRNVKRPNKKPRIHSEPANLNRASPPPDLTTPKGARLSTAPLLSAPVLPHHMYTPPLNRRSGQPATSDSPQPETSERMPWTGAQLEAGPSEYQGICALSQVSGTSVYPPYASAKATIQTPFLPFSTPTGPTATTASTSTSGSTRLPPVWAPSNSDIVKMYHLTPVNFDDRFVIANEEDDNLSTNHFGHVSASTGLSSYDLCDPSNGDGDMYFKWQPSTSGR